MRVAGETPWVNIRGRSLRRRMCRICLFCKLPMGLCRKSFHSLCVTRAYRSPRLTRDKLQPCLSSTKRLRLFIRFMMSKREFKLIGAAKRKSRLKSTTVRYFHAKLATDRDDQRETITPPLPTAPPKQQTAPCPPGDIGPVRAGYRQSQDGGVLPRSFRGLRSALRCSGADLLC